MKPVNQREGGEGRGGEGREDRAKPGNQLVCNNARRVPVEGEIINVYDVFEI